MNYRRTYVVSEALVELLLNDVADGADPLVKLAELLESATTRPDGDCAPGPDRLAPK